MTSQQLEHFRKVLEQLQSELESELAALSGSTAPVAPDSAIGRLTRQDAMLSQQMALEMKRRQEARLRQVREALRRVESGSYGVCVRCEEEISEARLRVRPEAQVCIHCAENRPR
ncbi:MAG: TraR/DksA family transcriptional regulator [Bryobacteraceae bacterium]